LLEFKICLKIKKEKRKIEKIERKPKPKEKPEKNSIKTGKTRGLLAPCLLMGRGPNSPR
jgi:hypothetical protein